MKTFYLTFMLICLSFLKIDAQITSDPSPPEADKSVTLYFDKTGTPLENYQGNLYAHTGVTIDGQDWQNVIGSWGDNSSQPQFIHQSGNVYKLEITPSITSFYNVEPNKTITKMAFVVRNAEGNQQTSSDIFINVGALQVNLIHPLENSTTNVNSGSSFNIQATSTIHVNWTLERNGNAFDQVNDSNSFDKNYTITENQSFVLTATNPTTGEKISKSFQVFISPTVASETIPTGLKQGINYSNDLTKAQLVLFAPQKEFIHVIGSFNNWQLSNDYVMKRDTSNPDLYWLEIDNLNPNETYTFQYRTSDGVKTADPYSTLVLSPYDDPYITTYPNLPTYPQDQEFEVSVIQTNPEKYNWQTQNFERPNKENLVIYELLIRDFNTEKTWQSLIDDFDYFKNLNVNAIELMPVSEFEGNISWGYNTAYHLALDKAYGTANKMKEFVDLCHQNGIAVILDIALNHVYGRSPLVRMWMNDPDGDGFGEPTANNPYANQEAKHSYNVGYDLNHQLEPTQYYVERTISHWINEYKVDGIRWDLTKGFTQNCSANDEFCTNDYQADRVAILKKYADKQWNIDPNSYIIFEHLGHNGSAQEETEWANYRNDEGKGIMLWGKATNNFNQNTMGYASDSNFDWLKHTVKGFTKKHLVAYAESHDEERMMYKNLQYGASSGTYNIKDLKTSLERQKALGAVLFTIPGPKMLWQFGELGYDYSINHCEDGTNNDGCRTNPKPIPSEIGYLTNTDRKSVYDVWAKIIGLKLNNKVFETDNYTITSGDLKPRIQITNNLLSSSDLYEVIVIANFTTSTQAIAPLFPFTGNWYNLMDETTLNVTNTNSSFTVNLNPGEFRIFGNAKANLSTDNIEVNSEKISVTPNPVSSSFSLNINSEKVKIYDLTGKLIKEFSGKFSAIHQFNIKELPKGIYILDIEAKNRKSSAKLIKN
ncbi:alpha-amylase family glycosyl hydrolase [Empedobacter sp. GD03861]|uniref:alpha-amylase family glycosyl hydrolase n=1 Tax=Empedobacter sp. GD03861 TaxID=2975390 RepID=UPI0024494E3C|nr:alpha-amylase family glycosyl hydrolase [Empedobacter sp. GD03861]MDH0673252.1 alpha-amylase family glycosyl hydrolase [Empedobacter sp. GD03861]